MQCQPNAQRVDPLTERPPIVFIARALEKTLDDLPTESPWWPALNELHADLADALEPDA